MNVWGPIIVALLLLIAGKLGVFDGWSDVLGTGLLVVLAIIAIFLVLAAIGYGSEKIGNAYSKLDRYITKRFPKSNGLILLGMYLTAIILIPLICSAF